MNKSVSRVGGTILDTLNFNAYVFFISNSLTLGEKKAHLLSWRVLDEKMDDTTQPAAG